MKKRKSVAIGNVVGQGVKCIKGLQEHPDVAVAATTEVVMTGVVDGATKAIEEYRDAYSASLAAANALNAKMAEAAVFIALTRENLKPKLGARYNQSWGKLGFFGSTLKVPPAIESRLTLIKGIEDFFTAEPTMEIAGAVTAALAATTHGELADAMIAASNGKVVSRQKREVRDVAMEALRQRITALRAELKPLLGRSDPRWLDFGFDVPTDVHVTSAPEGLKLTIDAVTHHVVASWGDTVHTDRFRVYQRVIGTDTEYVPVDTTTNTSFDLGTFASGAHLDVQVTAINAAGESVPSEAVTIVVP